MSATMPMQLVVENEDGQRRSYPLERAVAGELILGRDASRAQIVLDERNVSRRHAKLRWEADGDLLIEDLGSYNGVFVNGQRIRAKQTLGGGDVLRIGDFQLELLGVRASRAESTQRIVLSQGEDHTQPDGLSARSLPVEKTQPDRPVHGVALAPEATAPATAPREPAAAPGPTLTPPAPAEPLRAQASPLDVDGTAIVLTPESRAQLAHLVVINTKLIGHVFALTPGRQTLGRGEDNELQLLHRSISRRHLELHNEAGRVRVTDRSSANGLAINGEPYAVSELKDGDVLELGHVRLRFVGLGRPVVLSGHERRLAYLRRFGRSLRLGAAVAAMAVFLVVGVQLGRRERAAVPTPDAALHVQLGAPALEARALLAQARQAAAEHQYRRAVALANAALALDPTVEGAASLLERTSAEDRGESALARATAAKHQGNFELAQHELDEVPEDTEAGIHATALKGQVRSGLIDNKLQKARQALAHDHPDEAHQVASELQSLAPDDPSVIQLHQDVEHVQGALLAQAVIHEGEGRHRGNLGEAKARFAEAQRVLQAGEYFHALEILSRCVAADTSFAPCHRTLGQTYVKLGNNGRAVQSFRQYLKLEPKARDAQQMRATLKQLEADAKRMASE